MASPSSPPPNAPQGAPPPNMPFGIPPPFGFMPGFSPFGPSLPPDEESDFFSKLLGGLIFILIIGLLAGAGWYLYPKQFNEMVDKYVKTEYLTGMLSKFSLAKDSKTEIKTTTFSNDAPASPPPQTQTAAPAPARKKIPRPKTR